MSGHSTIYEKQSSVTGRRSPVDFSSEERFLVTGAMGCIGAWVVYNLVQEGVPTTVFDLSDNPRRLRLLMGDDEIGRVRFMSGDITDPPAVAQALRESGATHVIHLAALQVPFCRADPVLGARVNVVGTVNLFEAVRQAGDQIRGLAYASSVAALGPDDFYPQKPVPDDVPLRPDTLYGVYKQANEHTARLYWQDWQVGSIGLRPHVVYGAGRDQGLTSDLAKAILATAANRPFHMRFSGPVALQYADDVARIFIAAARAEHRGAAVCNLRQDVVEVADFVGALEAEAPGARITQETNRPLPFPADLDDSGLRRLLGDVPHTPLSVAIRQSLDLFRSLLTRGRINLGQLDS